MDLNRLKYFCAVAETGSLTEASRLIGISHSGLSKAMTQLQSEFDRELFVPIGRGLELTDDGKKFYQDVLPVLEQIESLKVGKIENKPKIKVGMSELMSICTIDNLVSEFSDHKLACSILKSEDISEHLLAQKIDFAFGFIPYPIPGVEFLELGKVQFNSYYNSEKVSADELAEHPSSSPLHAFDKNILNIKHRDGWPEDIERNESVYLSHFSLSLRSLISGNSSTYLPDFFAYKLNAEANSSYIKLVPHHKKARSTRTVYLIKRKKSTESKTIKRACKSIRKAIKFKSKD